MQGDAGAVFREALRALRESGSEFMLVGATAFGLYTLPRASLDLDFLVEGDPERLPRLRSLFHMVEESRDPVFGQTTWIVELPGRVTPIELFIAAHWFTKQALGRRKEVQVAAFGGPVPVGTPEDLALLKAANAVHPGRPTFKQATDRADLGRLFAAGLQLDLPYLTVNAVRLGPAVVRLLEECGLKVG